MNKSGIEWTEFTSNPVKGKCPVDCSYCYVKPLRHRYGWHDDIRFYPKELEAIRRRKKPAKIFVGSTIELFHEQTIQYMPEIMEAVGVSPQHTFIFLTKQPQNLSRFSPFPDNVWIGVSVTNLLAFYSAMHHMASVKATIKYISYEPLLESMAGAQPIEEHLTNGGIQWLLIGSQTKPTVMPKKVWVDEIIGACKKANIPYFLKDNLKPLMGDDLVQEMPRQLATKGG